MVLSFDPLDMSLIVFNDKSMLFLTLMTWKDNTSDLKEMTFYYIVYFLNSHNININHNVIFLNKSINKHKRMLKECCSGFIFYIKVGMNLIQRINPKEATIQRNI